MINNAFKHYNRHKDNELRFVYPNGYGKHKNRVVLTCFQGEPVAEVYLDNINFTLIDVGSLYLLESSSFMAHRRNDGQLCARASSLKREYLHRALLKPPLEYQIDHINHNPLDNRIGNLRECSAKQNNIAKRNSRVNEVGSGGLIGVVHFNKQYDDMPAIYKVKHPVEGVYEESFSCEWEAAEYRDKVITNHFFCESNGGEWPTLNFIKWNFDSDNYDLVKESSLEYESYMGEVCRLILEEGVWWLEKAQWAKTFYDAYKIKYMDEE